MMKPNERTQLRVSLFMSMGGCVSIIFFFFQAEDGIRDYKVTGVQTCALPICTAPAAEPAVAARGAAAQRGKPGRRERSEEHTSELQSPCNLVCRLLLEKKKATTSGTRCCRFRSLDECRRRPLPPLCTRSGCAS